MLTFSRIACETTLTLCVTLFDSLNCVHSECTCNDSNHITCQKFLYESGSQNFRVPQHAIVTIKGNLGVLYLYCSYSRVNSLSFFLLMGIPAVAKGLREDFRGCDFKTLRLNSILLNILFGLTDILSAILIQLPALWKGN